jgi:hypothetical protein
VSLPSLESSSCTLRFFGFEPGTLPDLSVRICPAIVSIITVSYAVPSQSSCWNMFDTYPHLAH